MIVGASAELGAAGCGEAASTQNNNAASGTTARRPHGESGSSSDGEAQGALATSIESGANVAALGGFSGRESEVSVSWLARAVRAGRVRWVLTDGAGAGRGRDGRVGSSTVMAAAAQTCTPVSTAAWSSAATNGLYDCAARADALAALAATAS